MRVARPVVDLGGGHQLPALLQARDHDRLEQRQKDKTKALPHACPQAARNFLVIASDRLQRLPLRSQLNGYESSLYVLKVLEKLSVILTIDEDPIFDQYIVTLFRAVKQDKLNRAYQSVAESLYQELTHTDREIVQAA